MSFTRWQGKSVIEAIPVSLGVLGACIVMFVATQPQVNPAHAAQIIERGHDWLPGFTRGEAWRPLTCMFLHGGVLHIFLNGLSLWNVGPSLEHRIGSARFAAIYFGSGLAGSFASMAFDFASLGASGALCGLLATYFRLSYIERGGIRNMLRDPYSSQFVGWLVITIIFGFTQKGISNSAHIGGMVGGWIISAAVLPAGKGFQRGLIIEKVSWPKVAGAVVFLVAMVLADLFVVAPRQDASIAIAALAADRRGDHARAREIAATIKDARLNSDMGGTGRFIEEAIEEERYQLAVDLMAGIVERGGNVSLIRRRMAAILLKLGREDEAIRLIKEERKVEEDPEANPEEDHDGK